jgi:NAD(P)-dependent dehydrogenase (short-subunit alcohol dehydrogenase family)
MSIAGVPESRDAPNKHAVDALQPMLSAIMGGAAPAEVSQQLSEVSSFRGHTASAEDVANAIAFLASSEAAAITGVNLLIDTGLLTGIGGKPTFTGGTAAAAAAAQT